MFDINSSSQPYFTNNYNYINNYINIYDYGSSWYIEIPFSELYY